MSTGEFISEISVSEKGKENIPAVFLYHKDFSGKAYQREGLWIVREVEQKLTGGHQHDLNHRNKPDSSSLAQSSRGLENHINTESLNGTVQTKEGNKAFGLDKTHPAPEITSTHQYRHTLVEQDQAALGGEFREDNPTAVKGTLSNTEVNKEASPRSGFGSELEHCTAKEEVTSHLENERETSRQSQNVVGSCTFPRDLTERIQRTVILKRHGETGDPYAQNPKRIIQIRVTEFVVSGTVKKLGHTNPHELKSDSSAKSKSDCQPIVCKLLETKEEILFPPSQTSDSSLTNFQQCQTRSSPDMLTSSVVTALAPNWSARSKKQRQGIADVHLNATEQEMQSRGQEVHPPSALLSRDVPQQPFCGDPKPQIGDVFPGEVSNKENTLTMTSSRSFTDSLSGSNIFNLRNHGPAKRRLSKAFSAGMSGEKTDCNTEDVHPLTSPVDTVLRPVSPHSLDHCWSRSISQPGQFSGRASTSTTTGSLLLSLRKMNLSSKSTGTPSETQPLSPSNSLKSPDKKVFRMSEPLSFVTLQQNRAKSHLSPSQSLSNSLNKPKGSSEFFPLSTSEDRQYQRLKPRMFLYPSNNNEITSTSNTTLSTDRGLPPTSPQYSKVDVAKNSPLSPTPGSMLRRQHTIQGDSLLPGASSHTSAIRRTVSNVSDLLNNNKAETVLTTGTTTSSGIYGGIPRTYDSLTSSNLNTLTSHTDARILRGPENVTNVNSFSPSNNNGTQQAKTVDIPTLSSRLKIASTPARPPIDSPVSPKEEQSINYTSPFSSRNATNKTTLVQQSSLTASRPLSSRETTITNTPLYSHDSNRTTVDRVATSPLWQRNVEDLAPTRKLSQLSPSPAEQPDPLSPSRPIRSICAPTTFSSLRLSSPTSPTSPTPPSSWLLSQRRERETPVSSSPQEKTEQLRKGSELSYGHASSQASKFSFDLSPYERQRPISKTESTGTSVPLGSSHSSEKNSSKNNERPSMSSSPYVSLMSAKQTSSASSPTTSQSHQRSVSFQSTVYAPETLKSGNTTVPTLHSPYLLTKLPEEQLNIVEKQPSQVITQLRTSVPLETQGTVQPCNNQPAYTNQAISKYISDDNGNESTFPRLSLGATKQTDPISKCETQTHKPRENISVLGSDSVSKASLTQTAKKSHQLNQPVSISQIEDKYENKDVTDSQSQKWSLFFLKNQRDSSSRGKENKPLTQSLEKIKKNPVVSRVDQMLDRFKSFSVRHREEEAGVNKEDTSLRQRSFSGGSSLPESQGRLGSWGQSADREAPFHSIGPGQIIHDQTQTKQPKSSYSDELVFNIPQVIVSDDKIKAQQKQRSGYVNQSATLPANWRTAKNSSNLSSLMGLNAESVESARNLSYKSQPRRKTTSLCESKDAGRLSKALEQEELQPCREQLFSCPDIKYGLNQKRSFSVSSVQSSRPSGPGRISRSSSNTSSISDLTSAADLMALDDLLTQESIVNPDDLQSGKARAFQIGQSNESPDRVWSPFPWENECDPTPPPSPKISPTNRRLSQAPSPSSQGSRTSQSSLSPRGHLPSKSYTCNLSVFEESSSDSSTTDDEYYLDDDGNGEETEL